MEIQQNTTNKIILAHTLNATINDKRGFIKPIAEIIDDQLVVLTPENFCPTMRVFITYQYDDLEKKFPNQEIFKIIVSVSEKRSEIVDPANACKYVSLYKNAESLKPKDYLEVIESNLPHPNERIISREIYPGTKYIFINDGTHIYGPFKWASFNDLPGCIKLEFINSPLPGVKLAPYQIYKIDKLKMTIDNDVVIKIVDNEVLRYFTQGISIVDGESYHDYASDEEVIKYCSRLVDNNHKIIEKSKMDAFANLAAKHPSGRNSLTKGRLARLQKINSEINVLNSDITESFSIFLNTDKGKEIVSEYVEKNEARFR